MPGFYVAGLMIGDAGTPSQWQVTNSFIWQDKLSLTHGRHNTRFGIEFKRHQVDEDQPVETDGLLQIATFADFLLGQSAAQNGSPQGLNNVKIAPPEEASFAGTRATLTFRHSRRTT